MGGGRLERTNERMSEGKDMLTRNSRLRRQTLPTAILASPAVAHALAVAAAVRDGDYSGFFRLRDEAPEMSRRLMDLFLDKVRYQGARTMLRVYKPSIPIPFVARALGFAGARQAAAYCESWGCVLEPSSGSVAKKGTRTARSKVEAQKQRILSKDSADARAFSKGFEFAILEGDSVDTK